MKGLNLKQIGFIIAAVLLKNWIFQYYGWEYDVLNDDFDLMKILMNIGGVIMIIFLIYGIDRLISLKK